MKSEVIRIAKKDFLTFARLALREVDGTQITGDRYLEVLASAVLKVANGTTKRLLINLPPRHLKTQLCVVCFTAWILARNPYEKILIVSYSQPLADDIARRIRRILQSQLFKSISRTRIAKGHARLNDFATTAGGRVYAVSFDGSITGF